MTPTREKRIMPSDHTNHRNTASHLHSLSPVTFSVRGRTVSVKATPAPLGAPFGPRALLGWNPTSTSEGGSSELTPCTIQSGVDQQFYSTDSGEWNSNHSMSLGTLVPQRAVCTSLTKASPHSTVDSATLERIDNVLAVALVPL